jgi:choline dehydrogenase-like flavoprotein
MIVEPASLEGDVVDEADYVIVGTGAAGATAARVLAESGASVIMIEEGPCVRPTGLGRGTVAAFTRLFREFGGQVTSGRVMIPILQASCVGGSTVINSGIMWRTPEKVLDTWERECGLAGALPRAQLEACFEDLERELSIKLVDPDRLGGNGLVLKRGADALGYQSKPTHRTESGCEGSSRCLEGCTRAHRQSMNHSYVPRALRAGSRLYAECKVQRITVEGGRVHAAIGAFRPAQRGAPSYRLTARAQKGILVGASAIHTPALLQRSGLDTTGHVGRHFQGHPGVAMVALFDEPVRMWEGATQSYEVTQFRDRGLKIESLNLPAEMLAVRLPGVGRKLCQYLRTLAGVALAAIPVKARAEGSVRARGDSVSIRYCPEPEDVALALEGLAHLGEIFFAAGARAVLPGVHGLPERIERPADLGQLTRARVGPEAFSWVMTHLMGTCRMGPDPAQSAVDTSGQLHGVSGLYVIDSSVFPTNLGVNPQHTIMAIAMLVAKRMVGLADPAVARVPAARLHA